MNPNNKQKTSEENIVSYPPSSWWLAQIT